MEMLLRMRDRRVKRATVTVAAILGLVLSVGSIHAQSNPDETAIRQILDSEVTTWNKGAHRLRLGRSNPRVRPFSPWAAEITIPT